MSVFPGVTNKITLTFIDNNDDYFQLFLILLFNIGDTLGRYFVNIKFFQISKTTFIVLCWLRLLEIGVFILFAFVYYDSDTFDTPLGDILKLANILIFSTLNGYL